MKQKVILLLFALLISSSSIKAEGGISSLQGKNIIIGLVAKSKSNPVFIAAYAGAQVAAKEIGEKYGVSVTIDWQTPQNEDPRQQAQAVDQLARSGVAGIAIACSDDKILTPPINRAVDLGIPVVCFDSDAPKSKRFAYYGTDDAEFGRLEMIDLAREMNEKGTIAIMGGNKDAPNLQRRVQAVLKELKKYPEMKLLQNGVLYHQEIPEKAAELMARTQRANPQIGGWALVGGWPLFAKNAVITEPGKVKIIACDALPAQLEYIASGHVQVLLAQHCFMWGHKSVELLLDKIVKNQTPPKEFIVAPLVRVTKANAGEWTLNWKKWLIKEAVYR